MIPDLILHEYLSWLRFDKIIVFFNLLLQQEVVALISIVYLVVHNWQFI